MDGFSVKVDSYDYDGDFYLINHFATIDMERDAIEDFFRQVRSHRYFVQSQCDSSPTHVSL